jgi:hypothetical protein
VLEPAAFLPKLTSFPSKGLAGMVGGADRREGAGARGSFTCTELLIYACRHCVPGLQGCGKKKGSNTLKETCMSYVKPVFAQVSICIERTGCRPPPLSLRKGRQVEIN